ncbi:40-kDa huntingtin-associated protein-like [Phymastichus coffea]|uniref:40-kDa huntingtin-associated protein-like n=1 Tax=Phymastichus coffea TaxID=108790 RepID=UPI00273C0523|nr:40-kDa huntingtin-associated protein-like [Phymastichus coffea]
MSSQDQTNNRAADGNDFLLKYHLISGKLKKRFLRKPNVAEASDQFENLAVSCERIELHQYAGWCWLAAARCQGTVGNVVYEINLLTRAGRQFMMANKKRHKIGCLSIGGEDSQAAINAFNHAIARCDNQECFGVMSADLATELAMFLRVNPEGMDYLCKAIHSHPTIKATNKLVSCNIKQGDYVSALQVVTELVEMIENHAGPRILGYYRNILHCCEISRVLLLLILRPTPQRLAPSLAQVLEKYAWAEDNATSAPNMTEDELLLLQSLVLACQSGDYEALLELEIELWFYLDTEQKELLRKLIQAYAKE